jgi:hypothetical protein
VSYYSSVARTNGDNEVEKIRPKSDAALGWAFRPDSDTVAALTRGVKKLKDAYFNPGADKPHEGGSGNLAEALAEARKAEEKRRFKGKRRRRMARRVTLKELHSRKGKGKQAAPASKKKTVAKKADAPTGKLIPLKTICAELDLDPKATRVRLRRLIAKGDIDWHDPNSRWEFTPSRAKEIKQHLNG